jgi:hypothetical protein
VIVARSCTIAVAALLGTSGCGGARVDGSAPPSADLANDNVPAVPVASSSVLDRDGAFFLRLDVSALRASPIADVLRDAQRRGGLFRDATGTTFDPVEGLDAVASMAPHARITSRGISSNEWTVVALVRRAVTPREVVEATVLRGESSGWQQHAGYASARFDPYWRGHAAFVGASREIIVMPTAREPAMAASLLEQLADAESPIDRALRFDPGKLGEIRLAMGLPAGIGTIHLTGALLDPAAPEAGVLLEGELTPARDVPAAALRLRLEELLHERGTQSTLEALGLSGLAARLSLRETASDVRVHAPLAWAEIGHVVELVTDATTGSRREDPPLVRPVPPPAY